jgi:hypothetical protein
LTIVHGYEYPFLEPFFQSLKATGFDDDLVIFTSETVSSATKKAMRKNGATLIEYQSTFPFKPEYREAFKDIQSTIAIFNYRFIFYLEYLLKAEGKYNQVMLTDVRDVIFQKNPFKELEGKHINFFLEDAIQTFGYSELNYKWSCTANGKEFTDTIIDNVVSCAGVTIGNCDLIIDYLEHIKSRLIASEDLFWGFDQGVHNGYVYKLKPAGTRIFGNDDAVVATLGAYQPFKMNPNNEVVNSKDEAYAVVHQYDRSGRLFTTVKRKYIGSRLMQRLKRMYYMLMP